MTTDLVTQLLAVGPPGPEQGKASPVGLVIILLLVVAVFVLGWSMTKHLKKVPKSFEKREETGQDAELGESEGEKR